MRFARRLLFALALVGCGGKKQDSVTIAPPPDLELTLSLAHVENLAFVAARDGDGSWQAVPAPADGDYSVALGDSRYGVAYACSSGSTIRVLQATLDEGVRVHVDCGANAPTPVMISGTVSGLGAGESAQIDSAGQSTTVTAPNTTYSLVLPPGTHDAFALRFSSAAAFDRVIRKNDVVFDAGSTLDFDFSAEGSASDSFAVTLGGVAASETSSVLVDLESSPDRSFFLGSFDPNLVYVLPAGQLRSGEVQSVAGVATTATSRRSERRLMQVGAAFASQLPELPAAPTFAVGSSLPYLRPTVSIPRLFADDFLLIRYSQGAASRIWELYLTKLYVSGLASYILPDLSALAGFDPGWALSRGAPTDWQRFSQRSGVGAAELFDPSSPPLDGAIYRSTTLTGQQTF